MHGKDQIMPKTNKPPETPTPVPPTATPIPTPDSYTEPNPVNEVIIPIDIPGYSTVDPTKIQQQLADNRRFYASYGISINDTVTNTVTVNASQISTTAAPCSDAFAYSEYDFAKKQGLTGNTKYVVIYNNFSYDQCRSVNGLGAGTTYDNSGATKVLFTVINYPDAFGMLIEHETLRRLGGNQGDIASCFTADCVASAAKDVASDTSGNGEGGLNLVDMQVLGLKPNITEVSQGTQTIMLKPRTINNSDVKGIKLPFTANVNGQTVKESMYCGLRAPVGGDAAVKKPQIICDVWDRHLGPDVADPDTELPPLDASSAPVIDSTDHWTLQVTNMATTAPYSATVNITSS